MALSLHPDPLAPHDALVTWSWDPLALTLLGISAAIYVRGLSRATGLSSWDVVACAVGWLCAAFVLVSPVDTISDVLFSVHMTQHMVLMLVTAPLLVLGRPLFVMFWALPVSMRIGLGRWLARPAIRASWRGLTTPLVVFIVQAIVLWVWHIPRLYDAAVEHDVVHLVQHLCFVGAAGLFWWTLIQGRYGRAGYGVAVLYVFATALHSTLLGAMMTLSERPWYPLYVATTAAWQVDPVQDQQLGGLLMWVPAGALLTVLGLALFAAWLGEMERRAATSSSTSYRSRICTPSSSNTSRLGGGS